MSAADSRASAPLQRYVPAVGPRLRRVLVLVLVLFSALAVNSFYLAAVSFLEWLAQETFEDYFYQQMFLAHLVLGLFLVLPLIVYGSIHIANAHARPNRRAIGAGYALFASALVLLASGLLLSRGIPSIEIRDPEVRRVVYWLHVATPLAVAWLFVLHRLAGPRIRWRVGGALALLAGVLAALGVWLQTQDPRAWNVAGPVSGERYFFPSLARTTSGNFIPARSLMMDDYCQECHADIHRGWAHSVHRFASFNNPAYLFSVRNTRRFALERDGTVQAARFCAGCHDPVPFLSGAFDDPAFDDVNHPTAQAGITCTACHAITHLNSPRGNADYTIDEPLHYPFVFSENAALRAVNRFLVKANPGFHKKTFLKPLHRTPEFCAACHKVHLPKELNHYKWLRGQNHYDTYQLSGVSGHGVESFYYPERAKHSCSGCHMPLLASGDFGARDFDGSGTQAVHGHQFVGANTAIPHLLGMPAWVNEAHRGFLEGALRVDLFGLRKGGTVAGELMAPLRPGLPELVPGEAYLLEVVLRTLRLGHPFTQGTADSNEVWLDVTMQGADRVIGRSGGRAPDGEVDPWSHFVNAYVLDRDGKRIDRRNPEHIFTALYDNQIPPGAADVVHYLFRVPEGTSTPITIEASLRYRKFDTIYVRYFQGDAFAGNELPIVTIATDRIVFPVQGGSPAASTPIAVLPPDWERWNDYGIGLLRRRGTGELRQAEAAFAEVEALGRPDGPLNLARVYLREGRLDDAVRALARAAEHDPPAPPWLRAYFGAIADYQNGFLDEAVTSFRALAETRFAEARRREFDFAFDYRLLNRLGQALFERAKLERDAGRRARRDAYLSEAAAWFRRTLELEPENVTAHYGLAQIYALLGDEARADEHRARHAAYKPDDQARDHAIAVARRNSEPADRAAEDVVIYDLQRPGAYELPGSPEPAE